MSESLLPVFDEVADQAIDLIVAVVEDHFGLPLKDKKRLRQQLVARLTAGDLETTLALAQAEGQNLDDVARAYVASKRLGVGGR